MCFFGTDRSGCSRRIPNWVKKLINSAQFFPDYYSLENMSNV